MFIPTPALIPITFERPSTPLKTPQVAQKVQVAAKQKNNSEISSAGIRRG